MYGRDGSILVPPQAALTSNPFTQQLQVLFGVKPSHTIPILPTSLPVAPLLSVRNQILQKDGGLMRSVANLSSGALPLVEAWIPRLRSAAKQTRPTTSQTNQHQVRRMEEFASECQHTSHQPTHITPTNTHHTNQHITPTNTHHTNQHTTPTNTHHTNQHTSHQPTHHINQHTSHQPTHITPTNTHHRMPRMSRS